MLNLRYSHIDATFRSSFVAASPNNSTADASGAIAVHPGQTVSPAYPPIRRSCALKPTSKNGWLARRFNVVDASESVRARRREQRGPPWPRARLRRLRPRRPLKVAPALGDLCQRDQPVQPPISEFRLPLRQCFHRARAHLGPCARDRPAGRAISRARHAPRAFWLGVRSALASLASPIDR